MALRCHVDSIGCFHKGPIGFAICGGLVGRLASGPEPFLQLQNRTANEHRAFLTINYQAEHIVICDFKGLSSTGISILVRQGIRL